MEFMDLSLPSRTAVPEKALRSDPHPGSLTKDLSGGNQMSVKVTYARTVRRITLERLLVSLVVHTPERVSFSDILVLYDNLLWCQDKAEKDPKFQEKYGKTLEVLTKTLRNFRFSPSSFSLTLNKLSRELRTIEGFLIPMRNLEGVRNHFLGKIHLVPTRSAGIDNRYLPPPTFIGKGYRDKGTLRDLAKDGSPRWQEIAPYLPLKTLEELLNE